MKFTSPVYSAVSGSIAGLTYARNRGGMYARARAVPSNPNTVAQQVVRNALRDASASWALDLTDEQQAAWGVYASNVTVVNTLGNSVHRSGNNWYVGAYNLYTQAGLDVPPPSPTIYALPTLTTPSMTVAHSATTAHVTFDEDDEWANEAGGALLLYMSRPQNPGRNFFKGPYRFAGVVLGDATTAPTSPATVTLPFTMAQAGTKLFGKAVCVTSDGRYSSPQYFTAVAS